MKKAKQELNDWTVFSLPLRDGINGFATYGLTISGNVEGNRITGRYSLSDIRGGTYSVPLTGTRLAP